MTDELKNDHDVINNLKEIEIELTAGKVNLGPKTDLLLKICTKSVHKFTENNMLKKVKNVPDDQATRVINTLQSKPINTELQQKYNDI